MIFSFPFSPRVPSLQLSNYQKQTKQNNYDPNLGTRLVFMCPVLSRKNDEHSAPVRQHEVYTATSLSLRISVVLAVTILPVD
jgi:hypothetical protein